MQIFRKILSKMPFVLFVVITQSIQTAGVILLAIINKAPIECFFIYIAMVITRNLFGHSFHAKTFFTCTAVTWGIFYFLTAAVPPLFASIYSAAFLGIGISFFMHKVQIFLELLDKANNLNKVFKLEKHCDENKLRTFCQIKNLTEFETDILVWKYALCKSAREMEDEFNYSERQIRRKIKEIENKLYDL